MAHFGEHESKAEEKREEKFARKHEGKKGKKHLPFGKHHAMKKMGGK